MEKEGKDMPNGFPDQKTVDWLRSVYPVGTKVVLVKMDDPYTTLKPGDCGKVLQVDDGGGIHILWENGSTLAAIFGEDVVRKL